MKICCLYIFLLLPVFGIPEAQLKLSSEKRHDLEIKETGSGVYEITVIGGDPYLFTTPLQSPIDIGSSVMTFEYFSTDYLDQFQIFFGPVISENNSAGAELGIREGWTSQSIDLE